MPIVGATYYDSRKLIIELAGVNCADGTRTGSIINCYAQEV